MEEKLIKFAQIVEAGSFTKAANVLHISQPALSVTVAALERELGAPLLLRKTRPLQLTAAGHQAYTAAKEISVTTGNLHTRLAELSGSKLSATIGMTDSIAQGLLRDDQMLQTVEAQAHVSLVVHNSRFLHRAVALGELDMAFAVASDTLMNDSLAATFIGNESLVLVCHPDQLLTVQAELKTGRLLRFITYDQQSISYQLIQKSLALQGITNTVSFYSTSPEIILRLVMLQKGSAVLPFFTVAPLIANGSLSLASQSLHIERPIVQIIRRRKQLPQSLVQVTGQVKQLLQQP